MACLNPRTVKHGDLLSTVRCGQCMPCRIRRKQVWVGRIAAERIKHTHGRFLTLTYEDPPEVLDKADISGFMKRYRWHYGECRFFAVGEYGEESGRAHWHVLTMGGEGQQQQWKGKVPPNEFKPWSEGFVFDGSCSLEAIGYVAGYTTKLERPDKPSVRTMSLRPYGLGAPLLQEFGWALGTKFRSAPLNSWPGRIRFTNKSYPLDAGGLKYLQAAFLDAGGLPPEVQDPEERHQVSLSTLSELGTRIESERKQMVSLFSMKGYYNGASKKKRERI